MDLNGKRFVNSEGKVCTVKGSFENITIFEDNSRVDTRILIDPKFYTELPSGNIRKEQPQNTYNSLRPTVNPSRADVVDPNQFLNQRNVLLEQMNRGISSIPNELLEKLPMDPNAGNRTTYIDTNYLPADNSSAAYAVNYDPAIEAEELAKKYQHLTDNTVARDNQIIQQANSFNPKIAKLLEEEGISIQKTQPTPVNVQVAQPQQQIAQQPTRQVRHEGVPYEENRAEVRQVDPVMGNNYSNPNAYLDPMIAVFKKSKMNTDFKFSIDIEKKIPKLAYIEMMEESCETSIIEYLATEFTESILRNPELIKTKIADEIRRMIDEPNPKKKKVEEKKVEETPKTRVLHKVDIEDLEPLNEGVPRKSKKKIAPPLPAPPQSRYVTEGKEPPNPKNTK